MASVNTIWCSILKDSKLRELFRIEKDSGKVTLIIIYIVLIIIMILVLGWSQKVHLVYVQKCGFQDQLLIFFYMKTSAGWPQNFWEIESVSLFFFGLDWWSWSSSWVSWELSIAFWPLWTLLAEILEKLLLLSLRWALYFENNLVLHVVHLQNRCLFSFRKDIRHCQLRRCHHVFQHEYIAWSSPF